MAKKYWLGPGSLANMEKKPSIQPDEEIPKKVLTLMGDKRVEKFVKLGQIGDAPKSAAYIIAARNTQKALKLSEKEKAGIIKKVEAAENKIEKLEAENEALKSENKNFKGMGIEAAENKIEKLEAENDALKTENKSFKGLEKNLKSKSVLLEKLVKAHEDLRKENDELKKQLKEQAKNA